MLTAERKHVSSTFKQQGIRDARAMWRASRQEKKTPISRNLSKLSGLGVKAQIKQEHEG